MGTPWSPGTVFGKYTLLARIGIGGMAEIRIARQRGVQGFERVVVIKRILDSLGNDEHFVEMFLDEGRVAAELSHPNIVQIIDLGESEGVYFMVMEYLHGEDLAIVARAAKAAGQPVPLSYAVSLIARACEGLAHAHSRKAIDGSSLNIIHRDISPQNIFVTYDGQVKLLDFGIAKAVNRTSQTGQGQVKGKFGYMSPQQIAGDEVTQAADVWAMGVVMFELLSRSRLFTEKDHLRLAKLMLEGELPTLRSRSPEVPPEVEAIVAKALSRPLEGRYPTAKEMSEALNGWLKGRPDVPTSADLAAWLEGLFKTRIAEKDQLIQAARRGEIQIIETPQALKPGSSSMPSLEVTLSRVMLSPRRRRWLAGAGAALVAAIALGTWLLWPSPPTVEEVPLPPKKPPVVAVVKPPPVEPKPVEPKPVEPVELNPPVAPANEVRRVARGKLTLDTTPWTEVYLNGRHLGTTPLYQVPVPAGVLRLRLQNKEKGLDKKIELQVAPGKTVAQKLKL